MYVHLISAFFLFGFGGCQKQNENGFLFESHMKNGERKGGISQRQPWARLGLQSEDADEDEGVKEDGGKEEVKQGARDTGSKRFREEEIQGGIMFQ